jgi:CheY-like chemotaxis protein
MSSILLVEDEQFIREALAQALSQSGYYVIEAENGKIASQLFEQQPVDLVITDILMPEADGLEVILHLTAQYPDIKIIAMSGGKDWGGRDLIEDAKAFGAVAGLEKPINLQKFMSTVQSVLADY